MAESLLVPVEVGECRCSGAPHPDGDVVYLYPKLSLEGGIAVQAAYITAKGNADIIAKVYAAMIDHGVADWTFVNAKGDKHSITPSAIRELLPWMEGGQEVTAKAFELYRADGERPLARSGKKPTPIRTGKSSKRGQTGAIST